MARIPQQNIRNLVMKANDRPNTWVTEPTSWSLYYSPGKFYRLAHYGTPICDLILNRFDVVVDQRVSGKSKIPGQPFSETYMGGYSSTDVTGINSLVYLVGGNHVYRMDDCIYMDGEGPRYKKKRR